MNSTRTSRAAAPASGWQAYYRRRDALDEALRAARRSADGKLPYHELPGVRAVFDSEEDLLLAMHYRWTQVLTGYINVALDELDAGTSRTSDPMEAVGNAWRRAAAERPVLRKVLDAHAPGSTEALRAAYSREMRILAVSAGLSDPDEPTGEASKVGAAYRALLHAGPEPERRGPVAALRRLLASA